MEGPIRRDLTTAQLVDNFKHEAPDFATREDWMYSNSGYALVGAVIEAASGHRWHQYLEPALFKPLGMQDTGYGADHAVIERQVKGYITGGRAPAPAPLLRPPPSGYAPVRSGSCGAFKTAPRNRITGPVVYSVVKPSDIAARGFR